MGLVIYTCDKRLPHFRHLHRLSLYTLLHLAVLMHIIHNIKLLVCIIMCHPWPCCSSKVLLNETHIVTTHWIILAGKTDCIPAVRYRFLFCFFSLSSIHPSSKRSTNIPRFPILSTNRRNFVFDSKLFKSYLYVNIKTTISLYLITN